MREMDPTEEIEFEREMLNNQNLLIEVQSLKTTYKKLDRLPLLNPPNDFIEQIKQNAVSVQRKRTEKSKTLFLNYAKAVASIAAALMVVSITFYFNHKFNDTFIEKTSTIQTTKNLKILPWIDRNEVIQFVGTTNKSVVPNAFEEEMNQSFGKLRQVKNKIGFTTNDKKVILTSTNK